MGMITKRRLAERLNALSWKSAMRGIFADVTGAELGDLVPLAQLRLKVKIYCYPCDEAGRVYRVHVYGNDALSRLAHIGVALPGSENLLGPSARASGVSEGISAAKD